IPASPPTSPPFPYTTLFRSTVRRRGASQRGDFHVRHAAVEPAPGRLAVREVDGEQAPAVGRAPVVVEGGRQRIALVQAEHEEGRSEEHTSELQSHLNLVCRL